VKDANGALVAIGTGPLVRTIAGTVVTLNVNPSGFPGGTVQLFHEGATCSGPRYFSNCCESVVPLSALFVRQVLSDEGLFGHYQTGEPMVRTVGSYERLGGYGPSCTSAGGFLTASNTCCFTYGPNAETTAEVTSFDLSTLGLVPPFHVEEQ